MHKKFEINQTKIKGGCLSGRKVVTHNAKSDLPLETCNILKYIFSIDPIDAFSITNKEIGVVPI